MKFLLIPNIIFVITLALLTGYLTFLTAKGGLTDNRYKGAWKRLTKRGRSVFYILILIAVLLVFQEINTQVKSTAADEALRIEQSRRDSLITQGISKGVDSSQKKLFSDISNAFLKQELKIDTVKKEIVRIRDSARGVTNNYVQGAEPVLLLDSNGIKIIGQNNRERKYLIGFKSSGAASTNFSIVCYLVTPLVGGRYDVTAGDIFPNELQIPKDGKWATDFTLHTVPYPLEFYINIVGSYSNLDRTKTFNINGVYVFEIEKSVVRTLIGNERKRILNIIKLQKAN